MSWDDKVPTQEQDQRTYENSAEARRVTLVKGSGLVDANEGEYIRTKDLEATELLGELLKQLKIMNLHLALISDIKIDKEDI